MKATQYLFLGLLVAGIGGFYAGRISVTNSSTASADGDPQASATRPFRSGDTSQASAGARPTSRSQTSLAEKLRGTSSRSRESRSIDQIVRNEDALDRYRMMLSFIDGLSPADFEAAVSEFRALGMTEQRSGEYTMLLSAWAKADPLAALAYAKENTKSPFATDTILSAWASNDPDSAIRWAEQNHEGEEANPYLPGIIRALASSDPNRATQLLTSMPRSVERGKGLDGLLPSLLAQGNDATKRWIQDIEDESLRNGAILRVAEKFAETDPAGTLAWLQQNPGEAADRRVDDVFETWASTDENAAMSAYKALPAGDARSNALRGIVMNLANEDPSAAVALMDQNSNDVSERMVQHFAWRTFDDNPSLAVDQIARIQDDGTKEWMYRRFVSSWLRDDKAAAGEWLQNNLGNHPVLDQLNNRLAR